MSDVDDVFYSLHIDGLSTVFVSRDDADGSIEAWGLAEGYEAVHNGLRRPEALDCGVEPRTGSMLDVSADIEIVDTTGELAMLFRSSLATASPLISTLDPSEDPAPMSLHGKCVGAETLGPAGERRAWSCRPGWAIGMRHLGQQAAWAQGRSPTPVTDEPRVWVGRRLTIHRVRRIGGEWQAWADSREVWRGTLLGQGEQDAGRWRLRAAGPESWCAGNLASAAFEEPLEAVPDVELDAAAGETRVIAWLDLVSLGALAEQDPNDPDVTTFHVWVDEYVDDTTLVGATSYDDVVDAIKTILAAVEADATSGQEYAFAGSASTLRFSTSAGDDGVQVTWDRTNESASGFDPATDGSRYTSRLMLEVHEKVARILGYDPRQQNEGVSATDAPDVFGVWRSVDDAQTRWRGSFFAADAVAMEAWRTADFSNVYVKGTIGAHFYNFGFPRRWPPIYQQGAVSWTMTPGQEFVLRTSDPVYLPSSAARPLMADPADDTAPYSISRGVGDVTHHGLLAVEGPYRRRGDSDGAAGEGGFAFDVERERREGKSVQIARVCWREAGDGSVALDVDGLARLVVYEWIDPREYGVDFKLLTGLWSGWRIAPEDGQPITVRPIVAFDYARQGNRLDLVMMRALASSGTVGAWYSDDTYTVPVYGLSPAAALPEPGQNDVEAVIVIDAELADLGLSVPADLIQPASAWETAIAGLGPDLQRVKVAFAAAVSARGMFDSLLSPTGLAWSLAGGRYGLFDPWSMPAPEAAAKHITQADYAGKVGDPASARAGQDLRKWAPIDVLELQARVDPISGNYKRTDKRRATDLGSSYRAQTLPHKLDGAHLVHPSLTIPGADWRGQLATRWRQGFDFWARQNMLVTAQLHASEGLDLWPGDAVTVTDPWLANPTTGDYGISSASGWVLRRSVNCAAEHVRLEILVDVEAVWLRYAGACLATRYDEDDEGQGYRLAVADDWLGMRSDGSLDCDAFVEPPTSVDGGDAMIEVFAFDGTTWTRGIYGIVTGADATPGACWLLLDDALTGATWLRDHHHVVVLREYADQLAAWVLALHAPVCDEDGVSAGDPGKKWRA